MMKTKLQVGDVVLSEQTESLGIIVTLEGDKVGWLEAGGAQVYLPSCSKSDCFYIGKL